jgi:hypothetical protein
MFDSFVSDDQRKARWARLRKELIQKYGEEYTVEFFRKLYKEWEKKNPNHKKKYYIKNREAKISFSLDYYYKNKTEVSKKKKIHYLKNRDAMLEKSKLYYQKNREKRLERQKIYQKNKRLEQNLKKEKD